MKNNHINFLGVVPLFKFAIMLGRESSMSARRNFASPSEDSNQTAQMRKLI